MLVTYRAPHSAGEFEDYFKFRWQWLRKPLGLERGSEQDGHENSAFHIAGFSNEIIIAVGRLQINKDTTARIRYMAVDNAFRNQGVGSNLLTKLEKIAETENAKTCWLYARETATSFYLKNNYQIKGEAESGLDIKHQRMEKTLKVMEDNSNLF